MKTITVVLLGLCLGACAATSPAQREAREYRRVDFQQRFVDDRERCEAEGGRILVLAYGGQIDRDGIPKTRAHYVCG